MGRQNKKLIKNLERYEEKKAKQQGRKEKSTRMYNS